MAASLGQIGLLPYYFPYLICILELFISSGFSIDLQCPLNCTCTGNLVDCSNLGLTDTPLDLPPWTSYL